MRRILLPAMVALCFLCSQGVVQGAMLLDDILANLAQANNMKSDRMRFKQQIDMRLLLFGWQFTADVSKDGDQLTIEVGQGAPSFVPDDMSAALIDVQSAIHEFDMRLIGEEVGKNGQRYYIVEGERKVSGRQGAQSGKLWIDAQDWYIAQAHLAYTWGRLEVEQEYRVEQGRRVLHRQNAVARPLGARLQVDYVEYWFEDSESDIL